MYKRRSEFNNIIFDRKADSLKIEICPFSFGEHNISEQCKYIFGGCFILFFSSMCWISGLSIVIETIAEFPLDLPFLLLGVFMTILGIYCLISSYNAYRPKPGNRAFLEITPKTFIYSNKQNSKKHDLEIEGNTSQIDHVNSNMDKETVSMKGYGGSSLKTLRRHNCIIAINGCEYRFGNYFSLTHRDANLIEREINTFLKDIQQI